MEDDTVIPLALFARFLSYTITCSTSFAIITISSIADGLVRSKILNIEGSSPSVAIVSTTAASSGTKTVTSISTCTALSSVTSLEINNEIEYIEEIDLKTLPYSLNSANNMNYSDYYTYNHNFYFHYNRY